MRKNISITDPSPLSKKTLFAPVVIYLCRVRMGCRKLLMADKKKIKNLNTVVEGQGSMG